MIAQTRRLSWQMVLVIAVAVALVTSITITYWATHASSAPQHRLVLTAGGAPQPYPGDGGFGR